MKPTSVSVKTARRIFAFLFLMSFCCASVSAQHRYIQLLTPQVGWAFLGGHLFWTSHAGGQWKDITPAAPSPEVIASVTFLDTSTGWVLLTGAEGDQPRFDLAYTTNAGENWSIKPVRLPNLNPIAYPLTGQAHIDFVDSLHGWMNLDLQSSAAAHSGIQFLTQDGGSTWSWPPQHQSKGPIRFINAHDGWILSPEGDELYVTHDGAKTWQTLSLHAPPELPGPVGATYALPTFEDSNHGFLLVSYFGPNTPTSTLVLFSSGDGGQNWKLNRVLPGFAPSTSMPPSTVSQSNLITGAISDHRLTLTMLAPGSKTPSSTSADISNFPYASSVDELSFVDNVQGWVLTSESGCNASTGCGQLLATSDGGGTWAEITPGPKRPHLFLETGPSVAPPVQSKPLAQGIGLAGAQTASAAGVSFHLGFDISRVLSTQIMQTWWNSSPFWDTSLYLPGSPNRGTDPNLNAAWVTTIQGQGWGLIPIWFGLQAPCNTQSLTQFSSDPATAQTQGAQEADNAAAAAAALGVSGTIVYKDIENYTPDGGQCSSAVRAFLTGWVSEMHTDGYQAGVYGNPSPAETDFSQVTPLPDDAWIAKAGQPSQITIWSLSPLDDSLWANNQRIRQYQLNTSLTFGGVANTVDSNIVAAVVVAATGAKSPIFNLTAFRAGIPRGINNRDVQYHGLIVGAGSKGPFQYDQLSGSTTSIPGYPGAANTLLQAINDANIIVGSWSSPSQPGLSNGFQYSAGTYSTIDYPGATYTTLGGINDDGGGTMVGFSNSVNQAFLYNTGTFSLLPPYPGAQYTYGEGINGVGHIVGSYTNPIANGGNSLGFFWNGSSFTSIDCGSHSGVVAWSINDNDQVVGQCQDASFNNRAFLFDATTGTLTMFDYPGASRTYAYGINDNGQIVGTYTSSGGKSAGFLAATHTP